MGADDMGQYLQIGIVNQLEFGKDRMNARKLSTEQLMDRLQPIMDMNLFLPFETEDAVRFVIREAPLMMQLGSFLSKQFALYSNAEDKDLIAATLEAVRGCSTLEELVLLSELRKYPHFQDSGPIYTYLFTDSHRINTIEYSASLFAFAVEGKIFMEVYNNFLYYLERLIRQNAPLGSIAGAVRVFIQ